MQNFIILRCCACECLLCVAWDALSACKPHLDIIEECNILLSRNTFCKYSPTSAQFFSVIQSQAPPCPSSTPLVPRLVSARGATDAVSGRPQTPGAMDTDLLRWEASLKTWTSLDSPGITRAPRRAPRALPRSPPPCPLPTGERKPNQRHRTHCKDFSSYIFRCSLAGRAIPTTQFPGPTRASEANLASASTSEDELPEPKS